MLDALSSVVVLAIAILKEAEQQAAEAAWTFLSQAYAAQLAGDGSAASA